MKVNELKLYQTFLNQNGHLSLVHQIVGNTVYVLNYNGSMYEVKKDGNANYSESNIDAEQFFKDYPIDRINFDRREFFREIKRRFVNREQNLIGSEPVDLYPFIEGYFHLYGKQYPLTPDECYPGNYKLLLLK